MIMKIIFYDFIYEYDGIKIPNNINDNEITSILEELNNHIFNTTGFNIEFCNKAIVEMIGDKDLQKIKNSKLITYEEVRDEFEVNNFKLNNPISYYEYNKLTDELIGRKNQEFKDRYQNLYYEELNKEGKKERKDFLKKWLKDPDIRTYEKLDFYPQRTTDNHIYNTFKGFDGMKAPDNKNDFKKSYTYQHFKNNICKNDDKKEEYLTKWIANILQDPLNKTRTAMILQSKQGCGKDFFVEFLNKLLGDEYLITGRPDIAFGKFNKSLENKILCVFNETQGKDTYEINESIKDAITRNKINIERKGKDPITLNDATHYIFLSNNNNPVKIPPDDRRFFCIEVGEDNRNDTDFFSKVKKELDNKEYIKSFYNYFINTDYKNYSFYDNRPDSESYELMRETNIPVLVRFLEDY